MMGKDTLSKTTKNIERRYIIIALILMKAHKSLLVLRRVLFKK